MATIDHRDSALTLEEQIALYHVRRGLPYTPPAPPERPADTRWDFWHEAVDAPTATLSGSLDPDLRMAEVEERLAPYGEWIGTKAARVLAEQRVRVEQDARSGEALSNLEQLVASVAAESTAALAQAQRPEDPVGVAVQNGFDPLAAALFVEVRRTRREPFLHRSLPSARNAVYVDSPTSIEALIDNEIVEEMLDAHLGPPTTDANELAAAEGLRRRILAVREDRTPAGARRLMETLATARRVASRARQLNRILPMRPTAPKGKGKGK